MKVTIEIKGSKEVQLKLKRMGSALYSFPEAMKEIGAEAADYYANEGFNSQGGVFGAVWKGLSPRTIAIKSKLYPQFVNVPLVASGSMKNSFVASSSSSQVIITNTAPQYKYHQSTAARSKLPRRQMAGVNDPIRQLVREKIEKEVIRKINLA